MIRYIIYSLFLVGFTTNSLAQQPIYHFDSDLIIHKNVEYFGTLSKSEIKNQVNGTSQLNFNPVVSFNGIDDYLKIDEQLYVDLDQMTAITVFKPNINSKSDLAVWEMSSNSPNIALSTTKATTDTNEIEYEGIDSDKPVIHTYTQYFKKNNRHFTNWLNVLKLGNKANSENAFKGQIAELLIFDRVLSKTALEKINSRLALKYGISLKENQNYVASNNTIVWDGQDNSLFNHRITGIGRDGKNRLNQKQSTSSEDPDFLTIGTQEIAPTNNDNVGTIANLHYLIWGDNNLPFKINDDITDIENEVLPTTKRKWLMKASGDRTEELNTQLKVSASSVLNDSIQNLVLVINESGKDDFSSTYEGLRFIYPTSIDEKGIFTYDKVYWDKDKSGKDMFSFVAEKNISLPQLDESNSITKAGQDIHFGVYPNLSADGNFSIVMQLETVQDVQITIYDLAGKLYSNKSISGNQFYFLNNEFIGVSGIYNVVMTTGDIQISRKLIVN